MSLNLRSSPRKTANLGNLNNVYSNGNKEALAPPSPLLDQRKEESQQAIIPKDSSPRSSKPAPTATLQNEDLNIHLAGNVDLTSRGDGVLIPTSAASSIVNLANVEQPQIPAISNQQKSKINPEKRFTRSRAAAGTATTVKDEGLHQKPHSPPQEEQPPRKKRVKMTSTEEASFINKLDTALGGRPAETAPTASSITFARILAVKEQRPSRPLQVSHTLPKANGPSLAATSAFAEALSASSSSVMNGMHTQHRVPPPPLVIEKQDDLRELLPSTKNIEAITSLLEQLKSSVSDEDDPLSDIDSQNPLLYSSSDDDEDESSSSEDEQVTHPKKNGKATRASGRGPGSSLSLPPTALKKKGAANNTQAGGSSTVQKDQLINPFLKRNYSHLLLNEEEIRQDLQLIRKCWASDAAAADAGGSAIGPTVAQNDVLEVAPSHGRRSALSAPPSYKLQTIENNDNCSACLGTGELLCCDTCPRVFHFSCVAEGFLAGEREPEDTWQCRSCLARIGRLNADKMLVKQESKEAPVCLTVRMMKKSVSNDHVSLPDPDGDDEMSVDEEPQEILSSNTDSGSGLPLFKQLFAQMDGLNPRAFQLPISIRNAFQHVVSHPITGDYLDTHDTLLSKSSVNVANVGRITRKKALTGGVGDVGVLSLQTSLQQQPQVDDHPQKIEQQPTCFKCNKTDQLSLQPPPLLTHSFPSKLKGLTGHSQSFRTTLIKCDHCAQHWHLDCLDPPLVSVPLALRSDEWTPIDLLAHSQLALKIRGSPSSGSGSGSGWRPFHPLDQPLHPIPPVLGLDKADGDVYSAADIQLLSIAAPESGVFGYDRHLLIRPKWRCPLHAEWASPFSYPRVAWRPSEPAWNIYTERAGEVRQARIQQLEREMAADKERFEKEKQARVQELKRKGFIHADLEASTVAIFEPPSLAVPESKLIIEFTDKVGWMRQNGSVSSRKVRQQVRKRREGENAATTDKGKELLEEEDDDTQHHQPALSKAPQQPESIGTRMSNLLDNAKISLRPDMYAKFKEYGSEWSSTLVDELHEMTVGPDLDKFIPLVDGMVESEIYDHRPSSSTTDRLQVQETAAALLLFQLELQDRFAERHLGLDPDQA